MLPLISSPVASLHYLRLTKPIYRVDDTLKYCQESIDDPILQEFNYLAVRKRSRSRGTYGQPLVDLSVLESKRQAQAMQSVKTYLSIVRLPHAEQGVQRVIPRDNESRKIHEEFAGDIEEDKKDVDGGNPKEDVDLRDGRLLLKVVECGIF